MLSRRATVGMRRWALICLVWAALETVGSAAELAPAPIFSDHMVLQREMPVPVWGTTKPGAEVTVTFAGQTKKANADAAGQWKVHLDPMKASSEPRDMTITAAGVEKNVTITNVLVGEVWLGAGQSNMQIGDSLNTDEAIETVTRIRNGSKERYAFGYLQLEGLPALKEARDKVMGADWPLIRWFNGRDQYSKWAPWVGKGRYSGELMYFGQRLHRELDVPIGLLYAAQGGTAAALWLTPEMLENCPAYQVHLQRLKAAGKTEEYTTQFPREKVGELYQRQIAAKMVPFAIRGAYWDQGESGTGLPSAYYPPVLTALINGWRKAWGHDFVFLYTGKNGLGEGACTWDLTNPVTAGGCLLGPLPKAPLQVNVSHEEAKNACWQYLDLRGTLPGIEMIITSDLGGGLHPYNKYGYGNRTASLALGMVYGIPGEFYGPVYKSRRIEGNTVRISFDHVGSGLTVKTNDAITELQGFAVAGNDKVFQWAKARIDGNEVVLTCEAVPEPVAIRYAWDHTNPNWANLFNKEGFPAIPFRTDAWETQ